MKKVKGPWNFEDGAVFNNEGHVLFEIDTETDREQELASAHLIAAAPELLKALIELNQFVVKHLNSDVIYNSPDAHVAALKAIRKAEGVIK